MERHTGTPPEGLRAEGLGPTIDPQVIADWFGAPFAVLEAPDIDEQYVQRSSEHYMPHDRGTPTSRPVGHRTTDVTIDTYLRNGHRIFVHTHRLYSSDQPTMGEYLWSTLGNFALMNAAPLATGWPSGRPSGDLERLLDPRSAPTPRLRQQPVAVNGQPRQWQEIIYVDLTRDRPILTCGTAFGELLLSVTGFADDLTKVAVRTLDGAPTSGPTHS